MSKLLVNVVAVLGLFRIGDSAPFHSQSKFNFDDDWDYTKARHNVPLLNGSLDHDTLPVYTYGRDLKVQGLKGGAHIQYSASRNSKGIRDTVSSKITCGVCKLGVGLLNAEIRSGSSFDSIGEKFVSLCVTFRIETLPVCQGIFDTYAPEILPVLQVSPIDINDICGLLFGDACGHTNIPEHEWSVALPDTPKPEVRETDQPLPAGTPYFKVLHISDTHYDPEYVEGAIANCQEPLCCRPYSTAGKEPIIPAGKWGSYQKCDAPRVLIENTLRHIAEEHPDIDYIMWTGDLPPHDIWNQTKKKNLEVISETVNLFLEVFPNVAIFPVIGNHEACPSGSFAPPWMKDDDHSSAWIYNQIAEHWSKWLPASSADSVLHGGFYSVLLRPGFRLIAINTNYCHSLNWWLIVNSTDPASELKWLVHELQQAENNKEKVHLIGHIAPGSYDCMKMWSNNFYDIVERYEYTIVAQFYGHSHHDEFEVFYDTAEYSRPTNVAYLGPSVTTYENFNPAYRIYYIDGDYNGTTRT
ncbi:sphingomyelin phosphodiesterase-like isoform X2 [Cylas formicarius]|uniref:sphingomyelin phosphodiesterase-like isoform X2 n=1 Tax=Cylas formicarius TaxID=197179 RepID=UPI002958CF8B|nr:sphingomyelin phosphodiesterase-like isoform X2 [Cylas formicarius]